MSGALQGPSGTRRWSRAWPAEGPPRLVTAHECLLPLPRHSEPIDLILAAERGFQLVHGAPDPLGRMPAFAVVPRSFQRWAARADATWWARPSRDFPWTDVLRATRDALTFLEGAFGRALPWPLELVEAFSPISPAVSAPGIVAFAPKLFDQPEELSGLYLCHELAHQWVGCSVVPQEDPHALLREGLPEALQVLFAEEQGRHTVAHHMREMAFTAAQLVERGADPGRLTPWWQAHRWLCAADTLGWGPFCARLASVTAAAGAVSAKRVLRVFAVEPDIVQELR